MKLKQSPHDFRVEEVTSVAPGERGEFALYRLQKTGWTTPDAVHKLRRRWAVDANRVSYGGLKDRHAVTRQHLTIFRGPRQSVTLEKIQVEYLGQVSEPFRSEQIDANRFTVVLRHLTPETLQRALDAAAAIPKLGVPNYFDDQRFGSVSRDRKFVAKAMIQGDFEAALRLALAEPYDHDRADAKAEKAMLRAHWGDWERLKAELPRGHARSLADYLRQHPGDYHGAVARLRPELGGLYLACYQSYVWNRVLDRWVRARFEPAAIAELTLSVGTFAVPVDGDPQIVSEWENLSLPLPSARLKESSPEIDAVLSEEGLTLATMRVPKMPKPYFSKGDRAACLRPQRFTTEAGADELNAGRRKLTLSFELQRGAYATMIVKRLTACG